MALHARAVGYAVANNWWIAFAGLTSLAVLTQLCTPLLLSWPTPTSPAHRPHRAFLFAGVLLLPPGLFILLAIICHLVEVIQDRWRGGPAYRPGLPQFLTLCTHLAAGLLAGALYAALGGNGASAGSPSGLLVILCALVAYLLAQHLLEGRGRVLLRGIPWSATGALQLENTLSDFLTYALGGVIAVVAADNLWQCLLLLPPLLVLERALQVPALHREARTDSKTGLLNARAFGEAFAREVEQAEHTGRPLALIMADLDLLRNVNNTYGHLAGDTVLAEIGRTITESIREYDIAGRFGGEEFAIALPDTGATESLAIAQRLRQAVAARAIAVETSPAPIHVTMSLGLARFGTDAGEAQALIHAADMAVYQAKLRGRNCVVAAGDVPHFVKLHPQTNSANGSQAEAPAPSAPAEEHAAVPLPVAPPAPAPPPPAPPGPAAPARLASPPAVRVLITAVACLGVVVLVLGSLWGPRPDLVAIGLFAALTAIFELLQVNVYGDNTLSVSTAALFAIALISGVPGVAAVSAVVAVTHYVRMRPTLEVTAFNWATHLLAGIAPILVIAMLNLDLDVNNLALLAIPIVVASLVYFVIDTGIIACAIGFSTGMRVPEVWHKQFQWLAPHYLVLSVIGLFLDIAYTALGPAGVLVFTLPVLMMRHVQQQYVEHTKESMQELKRMNHELAQANHEIVTASHAIKELNDELFLTLAKILDARDPYVGGHAAQVSRYATAIASQLGLPPERVEMVRQAGFLHDIGKIAISEQVLHKPSRLTEEEYEYLKSHAAIGADLLETSRALRHLAPFVRGHHERWDGLGYPQGVAGEEIPLEARILAVCDAVEAMASDRPYQRGKSADEVVAEVRRCSGSQFDPQIVDVFIGLARREGASFIINSAREITLRQREGIEIPPPPNGPFFDFPVPLPPFVTTPTVPSQD